MFVLAQIWIHAPRVPNCPVDAFLYAVSANRAKAGSTAVLHHGGLRKCACYDISMKKKEIQPSKISVFLDHDTHGKAKAAAHEAGLSLTAWIAQLVAKSLGRKKAA